MDDVAGIDACCICLQLQQSTTGCQQTRLNPVDIILLQEAAALTQCDPKLQQRTVVDSTPAQCASSHPCAPADFAALALSTPESAADRSMHCQAVLRSCSEQRGGCQTETMTLTFASWKKSSICTLILKFPATRCRSSHPLRLHPSCASIALFTSYWLRSCRYMSGSGQLL